MGVPGIHQSLITIGEWRFFMISSHMENIVQTIKVEDGLFLGAKYPNLVVLVIIVVHHMRYENYMCHS